MIFWTHFLIYRGIFDIMESILCYNVFNTFNLKSQCNCADIEYAVKDQTLFAL